MIFNMAKATRSGVVWILPSPCWIVKWLNQTKMEADKLGNREKKGAKVSTDFRRRCTDDFAINVLEKAGEVGLCNKQPILAA